MTIKTIIGENGELQKLCNRGSCPAAIIADTGDIFVQGYIPDAAAAAKLGTPDGEAFVRMSRETFEKIARQVMAS